MIDQIKEKFPKKYWKDILAVITAENGADLDLIRKNLKSKIDKKDLLLKGAEKWKKESVKELKNTLESTKEEQELIDLLL